MILSASLKPFSTSRAARWGDTAAQPVELNLIEEEPLSIRVQGRPYAVVLRTPGDEKAHVAGFCLAEGIIDSPADIKAMAFCDGDDTNVVTVTLTDQRRAAIGDTLDRRAFISQSSCGICGKEIVKDLTQVVRPVSDGPQVSIRSALQALASLSDHQTLRRHTFASHAAMLCDASFNVLAVGEDVGRHNALDKAVGTLLMQNQLNRARMVILSSRVSYEMMQKSARAAIPIVLAMSRPTALSAQLVFTGIRNFLGLAQ
jgi:FdhD protein